jgi:putative ABC transport system substrate-binding protein
VRRRNFLTLVGGVAVAWPLQTRAQEPGRTYRLGFLVPVGRQTPGILAFFDELRLNGFVAGQNLVVLTEGFEASSERNAELVAKLVKASPDAILCGGDLATSALQQATTSIPLLAMTEDMVASGLVTSLARPGGNTTGISLLSLDLDGKRQDLLAEAVPGASRLAMLADQSTTPQRHLQALQAAAAVRGFELSTMGVSKHEEIIPAINEARAWGARGINVLSSPMLYLNRRAILDHVSECRLPTIYQWPEMAEQEGGFAAYGPRFTQLFRQRARMVAKVLRGAKPADIPVEQPTNFELVVNLKTAIAIGHQIPSGLLLRADKVIE